MSRCYQCDTILNDEELKAIYRLEVAASKEGKLLDNTEQLCVECKHIDWEEPNLDPHTDLL